MSNAVQRAEQDLQQGDLWLASRRLESCLAAKGYDAELLDRLGRIRHDMHDAYGAGRAWLASSAEGEAVEHAVDRYVRYSGRDAAQILSQLPFAVVRRAFEDLPPVAQARLRRRGLAHAWDKVRIARQPRPSPPTGWRHRVVSGAVYAFLALLLFTSCTGMLYLSGVIGG